MPAFPPLPPWEPSPSLPRPAFMHPLSPRLCLGNIDLLVAGFATPPHSTLYPQPPPQGAVPHPTSPGLYAPPLPSSLSGQHRHPHCCNMHHPLTPYRGLAAPQGYLGLMPSPSPYQRLVWRLAAHRGACSSHSRFPLLLDLRWSTHPPPPGLALAPQVCYPDRQLSLVAWSLGSGHWPPASLSGPRGLGLGLYLPCLG